MGIPGKAFASADNQLYGFHDTGPSKLVVHGCHAMALNENRHEFVPTLWTGQELPGTSIEQVWFAGVHADIGGGYKTRALADIPLVWMAKKAEGDGLELDWTCLPPPAALNFKAPVHDSCSGVFLLDSFRRTWREVAGQECKVNLTESLYKPIDQSGKPLKTINEAIHQSANSVLGLKRLSAQMTDWGRRKTSLTRQLTCDRSLTLAMSTVRRRLWRSLVAPSPSRRAVWSR